MEGKDIDHYLVSNVQFERHPQATARYDENTYYEYIEHISKNNLDTCRFKDIHAKNKVVKAFAESPKCVVKILDCYFSKLPPDSKALYLRPSSHDVIKYPDNA